MVEHSYFIACQEFFLITCHLVHHFLLLSLTLLLYSIEIFSSLLGYQKNILMVYKSIWGSYISSLPLTFFCLSFLGEMASRRSFSFHCFDHFPTLWSIVGATPVSGHCCLPSSSYVSANGLLQTLGESSEGSEYRQENRRQSNHWPHK